jgi:hypothetical protein
MVRQLAVTILIFGCQGQVIPSDGEGDPTEPDGGLGLVPVVDENADMGMAPAMLTPGGKARVTATALNLRDGAGTTFNILTSMPCGTEVDVLGGPMNVYWWNVRYGMQSGWASGKYLVPSASFDPAVCMMSLAPDGGSAPDAAVSGTVTAASIFALAKSAVGYSYYWGHGSWRADHTQLGTCTGTCPSCSHTGQYGADCSGFVAKVWQVPSASPIDVDQHPYSTYNFYNETTHWKPVPRSSIQPADAFVRYANGAGHIALYEMGTDPFGNVWLYEARGCATGVVYDLRTPDSTYITIRRDGL